MEHEIIPIDGTPYIGLTNCVFCTDLCIKVRDLAWNKEILSLPEAAAVLKKDNTAVDVGAYIGDTTLLFCEKEMHVWAFEPQDKPFHCLQHNIGRFPNTHLFNNVLGEGKELLRPMTPPDNNPAGTIWPRIPENVMTEDTKAMFVRTLDSYDLPACDFLKIDVEGYEYFVLRGAQETIMKYKPVLFLEMNVPGLKIHGLTESQVYALIESYGYRFRQAQIDRGPNNLYPWDIICVHRNSNIEYL